jgi:uncharacterized protein (DUF488 family)
MPTLYTIGHSTRTIREFIDILNTYNINCVIDIRSVPRSRYVPWFNQNALKTTLKKHKIAYVHLGLLGGLRHTQKNQTSQNKAWRNASFRNYADYMQTLEFFQGLRQLNDIIKTPGTRAVIMCAEAVPWRCHRSLVSDAEIIRHIRVIDIFSATSARLHKLTSFAKVNRRSRPMKVTYP